jgi:hypothetical protein
MPAGHELCLVPGAAAGARAAVPAVDAQQVLKQPAAQPQHRGADRQLHRLQPAPGAQHAGRVGGQARYFCGDLRLERSGEPPLSPAAPAGDPPAMPVTGLASQIASLTSTICSESAANSL